MEQDKLINNKLRMGDKDLVYNKVKKKYYRRTINYSESVNGSIEITTKLTPMNLVVNLQNGKIEEYFEDEAPTEYHDNNNNTIEQDDFAEEIAHHVFYISNARNTNNNDDGESMIVDSEANNNINNNSDDGESIVIVHEANNVQENNIGIQQQHHESIEAPKVTNNKRKRNSPRVIISDVVVKTPKMINKKNSKKVKLATTNVTPGPQVEPMLIDEEATNVEEPIIVNKQQRKSSSTSKTSSKRSQYSRPPPLISTVESKTKENLKKKSKLTKSTTSNTNDEQTNNNNNPENAPSDTHDFDLGLDPKLSKQILHNIIVKKCEHLKPREPKPSTSTSVVTEMNAETKSTRKGIYVAPLNSKGERFAHETERTKTKGSYKFYNGPTRQKKIDESNNKQKLLDEIEYEDTTKMLAGVNDNFKNINSQPSSSTAATTTNEFEWSYDKIGPRYKLKISKSKNEIPTDKIDELPVDTEKNDGSSSDTNKNKKNKCESEDNIISDLDNLQNEEGTEVLGVFVPDDITNYPELAKKFSVIELNGTEENSSPAPVTTHRFADSSFILPFLKVDCDFVDPEVKTSSLLADEKNIKIRFVKKIKPKERPHSYLCALFHCLRGRLVMTILTRTATNALSATFASCIAGCPTSNDIYSTWGPDCHQKKFSRDLIAIAGNIIGHRPKFMFRDVLNELFPNISAGRRIFSGRLQPPDDVKSIICYILLNAYFEAMENEWIQLELEIQQTILNKKITIADQGKISRSALHCPKCSKSLEEIERYRFHVMQCEFNTHPDEFLKIPSLCMVASKFKRESKEEDVKFVQELQSHVDNNPHIDEDDENEADEELEPGQIAWKDIPEDIQVVMRILSSKNYVCPTCNNDYPSFKSLASHIRQSTCEKIRPRRGLHLCEKDDCCKLFSNYHKLRNHLSKFHVQTALTPDEKAEVIEMHKKNEFVCHECNRDDFTTYPALVQHTESAPHDKVYKALRGLQICNVKNCCADFDTWRKLQAHKKKVHPENSEDGVMNNENETEVHNNDETTNQDGEISD